MQEMQFFRETINAINILRFARNAIMRETRNAKNAINLRVENWPFIAMREMQEISRIFHFFSLLREM